jgi:hydrogenase nickel incorporation protein HypA/HybF
MHELALARAIVAICGEHTSGDRVVRVDVRVGALRQVVPASLAFAFDVLAAGTPAEGAELVIEPVPVRVCCHACACESTVDAFPLACPQCGGIDVDVVAGEECVVESLELEELSNGRTPPCTG